jgi:hypothetical protein
MSATVFASLETITAFKVTAFKASLKTSVTVISSFFICLVYPVLVILLILVKIIVNKSSDKELL